MDSLVKLSVLIAVLAIGATYFVPDLLSPSPTVEKPEATRLQATLPKSSTQQTDVSAPLPGRAVKVKAGSNGHFYLDATVNGTNLPFLVDTGASYVALSYKSAKRAGIKVSDKDFIHEVSTANGKARVALVELDMIRFKNIRVHDVRALVSEPGALGDKNLLGNSFLSKLKEFKVSRGELVMIP